MADEIQVRHNLLTALLAMVRALAAVGFYLAGMRYDTNTGEWGARCRPKE